MTPPAEPAVEVSVVIPARNVATTIGEQLTALATQDFAGSFEVIVADNGSTDSTRAVVETFRRRVPNLEIVDASARPGINHARNAGAREARGHLILFCDGDDRVSPTWVSAMTNALATYDGVGGRLHRFGRSNVKEVDDPSPRSSRFLAFPFGANCGVRQPVWFDLGGFDESYDGGSFDDVEFFWRLQLAGYRFGSAEDAVVNYRLPARHDLRKSYRNGRENVRLHHDFHDRGYPGPSVGGLRGWAWIISRAPISLISPEVRARWLRMLARHIGRLVGSVRYRHFLP